jgi:prolyl-tRNA synthetase
MRFTDLDIQTLRDAPNNARTPGFAFLVRAGYLTREDVPTPLGDHTLAHLEKLHERLGEGFLDALAIPLIHSQNEVFHAVKTGSITVIHCPACGYADRAEVARAHKKPPPAEAPLPLEKVETPACHTIEALANYLDVPETKTAKAMLFTRHSDGALVFAILRGDMQLSLAKLSARVGEISPASEREIVAVGAIPGYASPIGLQEALIVVDDLVPASGNLVAGANQDGYHLKNVNYGRDYQAGIVCDLTLAKAGDACPECEATLQAAAVERLASGDRFNFVEVLHALAETYHDERGLTLPPEVAPFTIYLMHVPGKSVDTLSAAEGFHTQLQEAGISVLFDDREDRAGVKFNDADLIGCPLRLTVGEKNLADGMVELKPRAARETRREPADRILEAIQALVV